jgi:ribosomal peptide maturation radical SAM protein 1
MIKRDRPNIRVIFGGPNCSPPMGEEMLRCFPEIDYIVEGEADAVITPLVEEIRREDQPTAPGVLFRTVSGAVMRTAPSRPLADVDGLPTPDYEPFFVQLDSSGLEHVHPYLQIETSRGCWWGEKHHCSFCSLEDALMKFRSKSEDRLLNEIVELSRKHQYTEFFPTDSIISHRFYTTLLPKLARLRTSCGYDFTFFFEIKANIRSEHAIALRAAGVNAVQPGIESFSDNVLKLMDKGTTAVRQIQCLKVLAEHGIVANWNMIYRNPNETVKDYLELISVIPYLHHLPPLHEEGLTPMLLMRFSPYFERPINYSIRNVRPAYFYKYIFPDSSVDVAKLAFYFDYDHTDHGDEKLQAAYGELRRAIVEWRKLYRKNSLIQLRGPGFINIIDRRSPCFGEPSTPVEQLLTLDGVHAKIFTHCDQIRTQDEVIRSFENVVSAQDIQAFLDEMINRRLIYRAPSGQLINLPLLTDVSERAVALSKNGELRDHQLALD